MKTFVDGKKRGYNLSLNVQSYRRVKEETGLDLCLTKAPGPSGQPLSVELNESVGTLLDVLWSIVRPGAQKQNITKDDFEMAMFGPPFELARTSFFEELAVFCRTLGREEEAQMLEAYPNASRAETSKIVTALLKSAGTGSTTTSNDAPENLDLPTSDGSLSENSQSAATP